MRRIARAASQTGLHERWCTGASDPMVGSAAPWRPTGFSLAPARGDCDDNELRVFVPRSRRKSSVGRRGRGALLGAGRIWKFQAGGSDVEAGGAGEMV